MFMDLAEISICGIFNFHVFCFQNVLYYDNGKKCDLSEHTGSEQTPNSVRITLLHFFFTHAKGKKERMKFCTWHANRYHGVVTGWLPSGNIGTRKIKVNWEVYILVNIDLIISGSMWNSYLLLLGNAWLRIPRQIERGIFTVKAFLLNKLKGCWAKGCQTGTRLHRFAGPCNLANCALPILQQD